MSALPPLRSAPWTEEELIFCRALLSHFSAGAAPKCVDGEGVAAYLARSTNSEINRVKLRFNTGMMTGREAAFARTSALSDDDLELLADLEGDFRGAAERRLPEPPLTALYDYEAVVARLPTPPGSPASSGGRPHRTRAASEIGRAHV